MIRQTSIETFRKIEAEGLLSKLRFEVYSVVVINGPMTEGECWRFHFQGRRQRCSITPRFSELEARGVIRVVGERSCKFTGNNAQVWESTDNLPTEPPKITKIKCPYCKGKGHIEQVRLNLNETQRPRT